MRVFQNTDAVDFHACASREKSMPFLSLSLPVPNPSSGSEHHHIHTVLAAQGKATAPHTTVRAAAMFSPSALHGAITVLGCLAARQIRAGKV